MSKIITLQSYNTIQFYQIPQAFYHNPKYIGMNPCSRETYAMLRNLLTLSINNGWINEAGEIYVKLSREKLMLRLGIKKDKMTKVFKELRELGLIVEKRVGCNRCNEIYICDTEELNEVYSDAELLDLLDDEQREEVVENIRNSENQQSKLLKNRSQESDKSEFKSSEKQGHIKNNYINTKINKTKNKQQQPKQEVGVVNDAHLSQIDTELINEFKQAFGRKPSPKVQEAIRGYLNRFEKDVVLHAINIAGNKNKEWDYCQGILKRWWQEQAFTFDDVFEYEHNHMIG